MQRINPVEVLKHQVTARNVVDYIMDFERGDISVSRVLALFSYLIKTGQAWTLQGRYGRAAQSLIEQHYLTRDGDLDARCIA